VSDCARTWFCFLNRVFPSPCFFIPQGIPQLRDCFNELKVLTAVMLDKELPILLLPENSAARRRKYPILSMEKVVRPLADVRGRDGKAFSCFYRFSFAQGNILEKYVGTGLVCIGAVKHFILVLLVVSCLTRFTFSGRQAYGRRRQKNRLPFHRQKGSSAACQNCSFSRVLVPPRDLLKEKRSDATISCALVPVPWCRRAIKGRRNVERIVRTATLTIILSIDLKCQNNFVLYRLV
jgi:hypothetical protein